jgi:Fe-S cluster assembly protein SufD
MNTVAQPAERYRAMIEQAGAGLPGRELDWLETQRGRAAAQFAQLGFPTRKDEAWRYTSLEGLLGQTFVPVSEPFTALDEADIGDFVAPQHESYRLVIANGRLVPGLSRLNGLPPGIRVQSLHEALAATPERLSGWLGRAAGEGTHAFSALNSALVNDGLFVHVEAGCTVDKPIEVLFLSLALDDSILAQPRNLVVLESGASATLVERYASPGKSVYFNNALVEVLLEDEARLQHYRVQEESINAYHISSLYVRQAGDSHYAGTCLALGGAWSRTDCNVAFSAGGARSELNGLYVVGDRRFADFHLDVRHSVPDCASRENFKGIVLGRGRAVFDGRILVDKDAQRSDAHLSNANLLLSRNAEVDTKPQLEIYADDVKCSHGTSVGQLDPQQVFYLRSRGIPEAEARKMLCLGFAGEILEGCTVGGLQEQVQARLRERLDTTVSGEADAGAA